MKSKKLAVLAMATGLSVLSCIPAFAGQWKQDNIGWWYQEDNGSYPVSTWKWIDGNGDGVAECYYFNASGYMLSNTSTPDSYSVNNDGAWTVNGIVQTKQVSLNDTSTNTSEDKTGVNNGAFGRNRGIGGSTGAKGTLNGGGTESSSWSQEERSQYIEVGDLSEGVAKWDGWETSQDQTDFIDGAGNQNSGGYVKWN